ncbi:MAG: flagellar biosynthesis regulator FlaF [Pseudomonadota bacterium]
MYQLHYADIQQDAVLDAKTREREIIGRSIALLEAASDPSASRFAVVEATHFTQRVWSAFLNDLAQDDNQLPGELKASLISIGIWVLKENERIRQNESSDFEGIIDVSRTILNGINA